MKTRGQSSLSLFVAHQALRGVVAAFGLALFLAGPLAASEFVEYCREKLGKAEALLGECRQHARPSVREFLPGGRGPAVKEEHRVWLAPSEARGSLGLGCVLDEQGNARFFGIYFSLDPQSHVLVADSNITFADFDGNVGFQTKEGKRFVLLAMHGFGSPGGRVRTKTGNCVMPPFDRETNSTLLDNERTSLTITSPYDDGIVTVRLCSGVDRGLDEKKCDTRQYYSISNKEMSEVIYFAPLRDTIITRNIGIFIRRSTFDSLCNSARHSPVEYAEFLKEACSLRTKSLGGD
jgi:hypothetical protein